jgi:hypothetical protein
MKYKFLIPLILICNLSFSQKNYNFLIGGGVGFRYTDDNGNRTDVSDITNQEFLIQLNPTIGYFITKNLVVGSGFEYIYDKVKYDNYYYDYILENDFIIAPFIRYYTSFGLFLHAEFDCGLSKQYLISHAISFPTGFADFTEKNNYKIIGFSAGIGYSIHLNESIGLEPAILYMGGKFNEKNDQNDFIRKGILVNMGFIYYIK